MDPADELMGVLAETGTRGAVAWLHERYRDNLVRYISNLVPRPAREDVEQEVWKAVTEGLGGYRGSARPHVWLLRIAHHKAVDAQRTNQREQAVGSEALVRALTVVVPPTRSPSSALRDKQLGVRVWRAIENLRPDERELLLLSYVQDLGPSEIAQVIGHEGPANTISQRISRIVAGLRREVQEEDEQA
jgi:RNA polymerase sigma factor (sigma-70 family)